MVCVSGSSIDLFERKIHGADHILARLASHGMQVNHGRLNIGITDRVTSRHSSWLLSCVLVADLLGSWLGHYVCILKGAGTT